MKIKIFFIISIIIFLSGCTTNFNLTINEDLSNEVEVTLKQPKNDLIVGDLNPNFNVNSFFDSIGNEIVNKYKNIYPEFNYKTSSDNDNIYGSAIITTDSIDSLIIKAPIKDLFKNASFNIKDNVATLELSNIKEDWYINNVEYSSDIYLNIKLPFVVKYNNATSIKDNMYTWDITNNNNIVLKFVINKTKEQSENEVKKNRMLLILGGIVLIIGLVSYFIIITKKEKKG